MYGSLCGCHNESWPPFADLAPSQIRPAPKEFLGIESTKEIRKICSAARFLSVRAGSANVSSTGISQSSFTRVLSMPSRHPLTLTHVKHRHQTMDLGVGSCLAVLTAFPLLTIPRLSSPESLDLVSRSSFCCQKFH